MANDATTIIRMPTVSRRGFIAGTSAFAITAPAASTVFSTSAPPIPSPNMLAAQILNVKHGWTADGQAAPHAPTFLPDSDLDHFRAQFITGSLYRQLSAALDLDDEARTRIICKTIGHLRHRVYPAKLLWRDAGLFLASHPRALSRDLAFTDYATLWSEHMQCRTDVKQRRILAMIDARRADMNPPPCPVLWSNDIGSNQFVKLTHPFHVWEEGLRNLDMLLYPRHSQNRAETPDEINRLSHWLMIEKGCCLIYSLRVGGAFKPAATLIHTPVRTILHVTQTGVHPILRRVRGAVAQQFVPTHFMASDAFRVTFIEKGEYDACIPWGPEHHPPRHHPFAV